MSQLMGQGLGTMGCDVVEAIAQAGAEQSLEQHLQGGGSALAEYFSGSAKDQLHYL